MVSFSQTKAWLLAGAILVVGLGLAAVLYTDQRGPEPASDTLPTPSATAPAPAAQPAPAPESAPQVRMPAAPAFDVVRVAEDGGALVAGSALPGSAVILRVDGTPVAETSADNAGQFVSLFTLAPNEAVQIMTLEMVLADGRVVASDDRVVLTPRPDVVAALAEAAPETVALAALQPEPTSLPGDVTSQLENAAAPVAQPRGHEAASTALERTELLADGRDEMPVVGQEPPPAPTQTRPTTELRVEAGADSDRSNATAVETSTRETLEIATGTAAGETVTDTTEPEVQALAGTMPEAVQTLVDMPSQTSETLEATTGPTENLVPRVFVLRGSGEVELMDRAQEVIGNVIIDVISYSDLGDVQISGRAASADAGTRMQIYLDNRPIATALAENGGWSSDLPAVDPGVYILRVDQLDMDDRVVSRFETPFQREDPALVRSARSQPVPRDGGALAGEEAADTGAEAGRQTATQQAGSHDSETGASVRPETETQSEAGVDAAATAPTGTTQPAGQQAVALITVQPGHSLWRISEGHYGAGERYVVIYNANRGQIRDPNLIYPGQIFTLPE